MRRLAEIRAEAQEYGCDVVTKQLLREFERYQSRVQALEQENAQLRRAAATRPSFFDRLFRMPPEGHK